MTPNGVDFSFLSQCFLMSCPVQRKPVHQVMMVQSQTPAALPPCACDCMYLPETPQAVAYEKHERFFEKQRTR